MPLKSILNYQDYRVFLKDYYQLKKAENTRYSYRKFAQALGFGASNYLHLVVMRKRNFSGESIEKVCTHLSWSSREKNYFRLLVKMNQCGDAEEKEKLSGALEKILKQKRSRLNPDQFTYFKTWYIPVIREIIVLKDFVSNLNWISRKLKNRVKADEVKQAMELLERLGLAVPINNRWSQIGGHLTTDPEIRSDIVHNYHKEMLKLSAQALSDPADERDISVLTMSLSPDQFKKLKEKIIEFRDEIQQELQQSNEDPTLVAQLNIQFFKVTQE